MGIDPRFWHGKSVLLTGHTGFKGSWLALWLKTLGSEVVGYSSSVPTSPSLFDLARVGDSITSHQGDVRDLDRLREILTRHRPQVVFHMAAQAIVRRSYRDPVETYGTNVMGTVCVLEAVRKAGGVRVVVNVTSDKCYEERRDGGAHPEDDPKGGRDPYSSSKGCAELVTSAYRSSFFRDGPPTALASARAGNVIGGGDWGDDRLVPDVMRSVLEHKSVLIRNPGAVRPWQHVLNPLSGYLMLAQALWQDPAYSEGWNFGPDEGDAQPVRWLVERLAELWDGELSWREDEGKHPREAPSLRLDSMKARTRLGWSPTWNLEEGVQRIVDWYRAYAAGNDVREVTLAQIVAFEEQRVVA